MYDPLHHPNPGSGEPYPNSYWATTIETQNSVRESLTGDIETEVLIIGAGYTGMSTALHLAREHHIQPLVIEANQTAWGCSGRNAGFILKSTGRMAWSAMQKKWGEEVMRGIYQEACSGVELVNNLIDEGIDCQVQEKGYLKVAHKPSMMNTLTEQASLLNRLFGYDVQVLSKQELHQHYMQDEMAFGAIRFDDGFGLNPLKLALGYQELLAKAGVKVHTGTPALSCERHGDWHVVTTPKARIKAKKLVIASNGYTAKGFNPVINNRFLPVLSQIIVTQPLTQEQLQACNFLTSNVVMDTRALKYYYRKLPDNRILFGGRGAITGKGAQDPYYADRLLAVLKQSFPALSAIGYDYAWAGWICMSLDDIPHIYEQDNVFYGMGYCGSGVSFSVQAGKRLAQRVAGMPMPQLPLYSRGLSKFPLPAMRRTGQWMYFQYGRVKDKYF
ncbi:NAD(P)/FAD-dependent oxidoreductase [Thalassotalea mangrovi]|uniref:FAD-binding oxidoreductase n=1 Tax=Thalassotalea mangrovi TaxID=2572245 RepID=A0A4U1B8C4_9GAMM|nr:FAD-dependent oxidoreductase [Thalassotalea mangrovi]TKB46903.1 FAD-binding oxidoreductase [Thalassotalea mangrovi]